MTSTSPAFDLRRKRPAPAEPARRLRAADRERQIVDGAIAYFAEVGLDGQTRELARRLGITQPLLFRYFPTKQALIDRIYEEVFLGRWKPEWETEIADASLPAAERFRRFELDYQRAIDDEVWLRIFVSAGLRGFDVPRRYLSVVRERIFTPLLAAFRAERRLPDPNALPLSDAEYELLFGVHGALVYVGLRGRVYGVSPPADRDGVRAALLRTMLPGLGDALEGAARNAAGAACLDIRVRPEPSTKRRTPR